MKLQFYLSLAFSVGLPNMEMYFLFWRLYLHFPTDNLNFHLPHFFSLSTQGPAASHLSLPGPRPQQENKVHPTQLLISKTRL